MQTGPPPNDHDNPYFVRTLSGHHHSVRAIAAHGDTLVSGSYDCTVRVWKISTGDTLHRLSGHSQKVYSVVLDHARNRCISGSMDNLVKVWSLETGNCLFNLDGHTSLVGLLDLSHGPKGPDVNLGPILGILVKELWRHPVQSPDERCALIELRLDHTSHTKITQLHTANFCNQDICALDVSVNNALLMYPVNRNSNFT